MTVAEAAGVLRAGGIVGMPTETVYGLAADARNTSAVAAVFAAKQRPSFDPLIVHVAEAADAVMIASVSEQARLLMEAFWPGPLTLVLPRLPVIPDLVTSGLDTVGVRCPDHDIARALIRKSGCPLAAPSANRFGRVSPTTAAHVLDQLGDAIDGVVDGGACRVGVESTVLALQPAPVVLRPGGITCEQLAACLGRPVPLAQRQEVGAHLPAAAPGLLESHYAPRQRLSLREPGAAWPADPGIGLLAWRGGDLPPHRQHEILSASGDLAEAASNLFAAMRRLEAAAISAICAEPVPETGLGVAINDRLRRAAGTP